MHPPDGSFWIRKRYYVSMWILIGLMLMTLVNINLSICIVDLTSTKNVTVGNETYIQKPVFDWTPPQKGLILSVLYIGQLTAPIGAIACNKFGGVTTYGVALLGQGLLTILSPALLQWNLSAFLCARFIEGVLQGTAISSSCDVIQKWTPPKELARLTNISILGVVLGASVSYPFIGFINYCLSWQYVFYITGGIVAIWYSILYFTIENTPEEDRLISETEKTYMITVCKDVLHKKVKIPWKSMFTSPPLYAYWNERFVESWSYSFLLTCLPLYIKDVHPSNIKDVGLFSSVPHFCAVFTQLVSSWLLDYFRSREKTSKTILHKRFIMMGQIPGACLLIVLGFWTNFHWAMVTFSVFRICFSAAYASYYTLPYDMCKQNANAVVGIAIAFRSVGTMVNPVVLGLMTRNHLVEEWSRYFLFLSLFNLWGLVVFAKYGTGKTQSWATSHSSTDQNNQIVLNQNTKCTPEVQ